MANYISEHSGAEIDSILNAATNYITKIQTDSWYAPLSHTHTANELNVVSTNDIINIAHGGTNATTTFAALQNLLNLDETTSSITTYPTKPGIYRVIGTNIFTHMTPVGLHGVLLIIRARYALHLYLDWQNNLYYGYNDATTTTEPTTWYRVRTEDPSKSIFFKAYYVQSPEGDVQFTTAAIPFTNVLSNIGGGTWSSPYYIVPEAGIYQVHFSYFSNTGGTGHRPALRRWSSDGQELEMLEIHAQQPCSFSSAFYCDAGDKLGVGAQSSTYPINMYAALHHNEFVVYKV